MSDSWPAPPPADDASDSLAGQALEVERALKALEAVDAFRAEAAALRAELHAARASGFAGRGAPRSRGVRRKPSDLPEGAGRLVAECLVIVSVAMVAWAVHLSRLGILLSLGGTWLAVAVFEAVVSRTSRPRWVPPPPVAVVAPPVRSIPPAPTPEPVPPELPEPEVVGWPVRLDTEAPAPSHEPEHPPEPEPLPEAVPEPEFEPEPALAPGLFREVEPDGGPGAGAFSVLAEEAEILDKAEAAAARRARILRFVSLRRKPARRPDHPEPEPEPEAEPEAEPAPPPEPSPVAPSPLELEAAIRDLADAAAARRSPRLRLRRKRTETEADEVSLLVSEPQSEPEPEPEPAPAAELELEHELEYEPQPEPLVDLSPLIEPDGGPTVGAFAALAEQTARHEERDEPSPRPERCRLRLRRRRARV